MPLTIIAVGVVVVTAACTIFILVVAFYCYKVYRKINGLEMLTFNSDHKRIGTSNVEENLSPVEAQPAGIRAMVNANPEDEGHTTGIDTTMSGPKPEVVAHFAGTKSGPKFEMHPIGTNSSMLPDPKPEADVHPAAMSDPTAEVLYSIPYAELEVHPIGPNSTMTSDQVHPLGTKSDVSNNTQGC